MIFGSGGQRLYGLIGGPSFHVGPAELEEVYAPRLIKAGQDLSFV